MYTLNYGGRGETSRNAESPPEVPFRDNKTELEVKQNSTFEAQTCDDKSCNRTLVEMLVLSCKILQFQ